MKGWLDVFVEATAKGQNPGDPYTSLQQWMDRWRRNHASKPPLADWCGLSEDELKAYVLDPSTLEGVLASYGEDGGCCHPEHEDHD